MIGRTIGSYEVVAKLGEGGMGQVYRARDTRLHRDVAIKVLPDAFASDADRLARFKREAQALAALSHPNIAAIYGFEEVGTVHALVMELVAGADLSDVMSRGPIPLDDAIPIARQIVDALEAAHEKGIIHRDLKPGNVKVAPDGGVKVLDFGLAKLVDVSGADSAAGISAASTLTSPAMTQLGLILGTAAYMAPEQARGRAIDRRADIWAFGVVLFEMLTGTRAFKGDDISDVLASVLKSEPEWKALPANTPASIHRLLRRCLEKDPRKRLGAISDARLELDDSAVEPAGAGPTPAGRRSVLPYVATAALGALVAAGIAFAMWPGAPATGSLSRTSMVAPPGAEFWPDSAQVAISPDGRHVAFISGNPIDRLNAQLWVRPVDSLVAKPLEGTEGAALPFWKPDSSRIGFFAGTKMKSIPVDGGRADVIAEAPFGRGGTWNERDEIVFAGDASGILSRVSGNGGDVKQITTLDKARKEVGHRFPVFLPDGDHFLFAALPGHDGTFDVFAGSVSDPATVTLIGAMGSTPVYAEPGWLLYGRRGVLVAQPFDVRTLKTTGDARPLGDEPSAIHDPRMSYTAGHSTSVSRTGALAYFSAPPATTRATWLDVLGRPAGTVPIQPGTYSAVSLSPDGSQAVLVRSISPTESNLVVVDVARGSAVPLSSGGGRNETPQWSPDGLRVVFASDRVGAQDLYVKTVADAAPEQVLYQSEVLFKSPSQWSRDGRIVFFQLDPDTSYNVYTVPATGGPSTIAVRGRNRDVFGRISPDGKWLAYLAEFGESGFQLCVQAFPTPGRNIQLTTGGATTLWWTDDNRQIVYVSGNQKELWRVDVQPNGADLRVVGQPVKLGTLPPGLVSLDATRDRQRFLALVPDRLGVGSVTVVQNWMSGIGK